MFVNHSHRVYAVLLNYAMLGAGMYEAEMVGFQSGHEPLEQDVYCNVAVSDCICIGIRCKRRKLCYKEVVGSGIELGFILRKIFEVEAGHEVWWPRQRCSAPRTLGAMELPCENVFQRVQIVMCDTS